MVPPMPASTRSTNSKLMPAWRTERNSRLSSMFTSASHQHVAIHANAIAELHGGLLRLGEGHEAPVIHFHGHVVERALADDFVNDPAVPAGFRHRGRATGFR